jgi:hypothetical protein
LGTSSKQQGDIVRRMLQACVFKCFRCFI